MILLKYQEKMNLVNLNSFLKFGFFLDYENQRLEFDFSNVEKDRYSKLSINDSRI